MFSTLAIIFKKIRHQYVIFAIHYISIIYPHQIQAKTNFKLIQIEIIWGKNSNSYLFLLVHCTWSSSVYNCVLSYFTKNILGINSDSPLNVCIAFDRKTIINGTNSIQYYIWRHSSFFCIYYTQDYKSFDI